MTTFAEVSEFEAFLGRDVDDSRADLLLQAASAVVQTYTQQLIEEVADDVLILSGNDSNVLLLPQVPVTAITVKTGAPDFLTELVEGTDYICSPSGQLERVAPLTWGCLWQDIQVTYTHGWAVIPLDIELATMMIAEVMLDSSGAGDLQSETIGSYSYTRGAVATLAELPPRVTGMLNRWKTPPHPVP